MSTVREKIERVVKAFQAKPGLGALVLVGAVADVLSAYSVSGTDAERAQYAQEGKDAWREFVTPIDIRGVPNSFEPMVDALIESAVSSTIDAGLVKLAEFRAEVDAIVQAA
jgi:hypothetical protein